MVVAVPTFPTGAWNIDLNTNNETSFAVLENTFGDGYIQRATDGLNSNRDTWQATYTNLTDAEATLLMNFFKERAGFKPFYWQAPGDVDIKQWTARDVKRQPMGVSNNLAFWKVSATLKQEFGATIEVKTPVFLPGVGAQGMVGTIVGNCPTIQLFGVVGTGAVGLITPQKVTIHGVAGIGSAGIILGGSLQVRGVGGQGVAGSLSVSNDNVINKLLRSVEGIGRVGDVGPGGATNSFNVTGVAATSAVGSISETIFNNTDPNIANVKLLVGFESMPIADESPAAHGNASLNNGASNTTSFFKFGAASLQLSGNNDISWPDSADFNFGAGQFTVEAFIRPTSVTGTQFLVGQWQNAGNLGWILYLNNAQLAWNTSTTGSDNNADISAGTISNTTWHHVAVDFDGTKYRLYIDGAKVGSFATPRTLFDSTDVLSVGSNHLDNGFWFNGQMDELRITKGVARYATDTTFTVPAAAFSRH